MISQKHLIFYNAETKQKQKILTLLKGRSTTINKRNPKDIY